MAATLLIAPIVWMLLHQSMTPAPVTETVSKSRGASSASTTPTTSTTSEGTARAALDEMTVKGRAPKTGYARTQFGDGWAKTNGCDTRNIILKRDIRNPVIASGCRVMSGILPDPYTGTDIVFTRGTTTSAMVQIDHVVALSNAWQTGAQQLSAEQRTQLANDPLELLAVDGRANQQKSDGDAATWLPPNKVFRCEYVARQISVKRKYGLWVTEAEKEAMYRVLDTCPSQPVSVQ